MRYHGGAALSVSINRSNYHLRKRRDAFSSNISPHVPTTFVGASVTAYDRCVCPGLPFNRGALG